MPPTTPIHDCAPAARYFWIPPILRRKILPIKYIGMHFAAIPPIFHLTAMLAHCQWGVQVHRGESNCNVPLPRAPPSQFFDQVQIPAHHTIVKWLLLLLAIHFYFILFVVVVAPYKWLTSLSILHQRH